MRPQRPTRLILVLWVTAACCACATSVPRFPLAEGDPRPRALIEGWNEAARQRQSLRARATLTVDAPNANFRLNQVLVLERPSRLRVEVLGFLDQTVAVLVIDGQRYEFFNAKDRTYESAEVRDGLLWQYARIDLTPGEAIELLLGAPSLDGSLRPTGATTTEAGAIRADLVDSSGVIRESVEFDPAGRLTNLEVRDSQGVLDWRARFADYTEVEGGAVATKIALYVSEGKSRAKIELRDAELAPDLPPGLFQLRSR